MDDVNNDLQLDLMKNLGLDLGNLEKKNMDKNSTVTENKTNENKKISTLEDINVKSHTPLFFTKEEQEALAKQEKISTTKYLEKLDDDLLQLNDSDVDSEEELYTAKDISVENYLNSLYDTGTSNPIILSAVSLKDDQPLNDESIPCYDIDSEGSDELEIIGEQKNTSTGTDINVNGYTKFKCQYCHSEISGIQNMRSHLIECERRKQSLFCDICNIEFESVQVLQAHLKRHLGGKRPHHCPYCDYSAAASNTLKCHIRTHTNERPFSCSFCSYRSNTSSSLRTHIRTHTGEKPYQCPYCPHRSNTSSALKDHIRRHTGERLRRCRQCSFRTSSKEKFDLHKLEHNVESV